MWIVYDFIAFTVVGKHWYFAVFGAIAEYQSTFKDPLEILVATWLHSEF
jgi:hypothetical protein